MKSIKQVPLDQIRMAIGSSLQLTEAIKKLGFHPLSSSVATSLKQICKDNGISLSHLRFLQSKETWEEDNLRSVVARQISYSGTLQELKLSCRSGNFDTLKSKIAKYNISTAHFDPAVMARITKDKNGTNTKQSLDLILSGKGKTITSSALKNQLIKAGLKERICEQCKLTEWQGQPIPIELNHKDGINTNNVYSNLEILCPNCHALTPTYNSKNIVFQRQKNNLTPVG